MMLGFDGQDSVVYRKDGVEIESVNQSSGGTQIESNGIDEWWTSMELDPDIGLELSMEPVSVEENDFAGDAQQHLERTHQRDQEFDDFEDQSYLKSPSVEAPAVISEVQLEEFENLHGLSLELFQNSMTSLVFPNVPSEQTKSERSETSENFDFLMKFADCPQPETSVSAPPERNVNGFRDQQELDYNDARNVLPMPATMPACSQNFYKRPTISAVELAQRRAEGIAQEALREKQRKSGPPTQSSSMSNGSHSSDIKKQKRVQKNRDSAFVSRIRHRAYSTCLAESIALEEDRKAELSLEHSLLLQQISALKAEAAARLESLQISQSAWDITKQSFAPVSRSKASMGVTTLLLFSCLFGLIVPGLQPSHSNRFGAWTDGSGVMSSVTASVSSHSSENPVSISGYGSNAAWIDPWEAGASLVDPRVWELNDTLCGGAASSSSESRLIAELQRKLYVTSIQPITVDCESTMSEESIEWLSDLIVSRPVQIESVDSFLSLPNTEESVAS